MTVLRSPRSPSRSIGVGIGLFALILQLLLPMGLAVASAGYESYSSPFGLCLSDDGRRLFLGFDDPSETNRSYECPLCIATKDAPVALPSDGRAFNRAPQEHTYHYPRQINDKAAFTAPVHQHWIRGPPNDMTV